MTDLYAVARRSGLERFRHGMAECFISPEEQERRGQLEKQYRHRLVQCKLSNSYWGKKWRMPVLRTWLIFNKVKQTIKCRVLHRCETTVMLKQAYEKQIGTGISEYQYWIVIYFQQVCVIFFFFFESKARSEADCY